MDTEKEIQVRQTSDKSAEVTDDIVICVDKDEQGKRFRKVIKANFVKNEKNPEAAVGITLRHQRRHNVTEEWYNPENFNCRSLLGGQEIQFPLRHRETLILFQELCRLYEICDCGLPPVSGTYRLIDEETGEIIDSVETDVLKLLFNNDPDFLRKLKDIDPESITNFVLNELLESRRRTVAEFKEQLELIEIIGFGWDEHQWANFFRDNQWIFGYGLSYQFLILLKEQPHYGGSDFDGQGTQIGDSMMATCANARFTVLVEIKKPKTELLKKSDYRNGAYPPSNELSGAVTQVQINCATWGKESQYVQNTDKLHKQHIYTSQPKGIVVIGNTSELGDDLHKLSSFHLFRRNLQNPEIITYDELLARAEFITGKADCASSS